MVALRVLAKRADGRTDPDQVIEWAINVGYLKASAARAASCC